jgi:hypothetical protein
VSCKVHLISGDRFLSFLTRGLAQWSELIQRQTHLAATGAAPLLEISSDSRQANFSPCLVNVSLVGHATER